MTQQRRARKNRKKRVPPARLIAEAVGRSPMHVWRILNKKGQYSPETAERVKAFVTNWRQKQAA